ncbi:MAG: triosephosphate isomerase [Candidatus Peribacteraceae bacterium]|nr:triosephosphate isomerase [Candidatus Peribacteraceae bacterium]
MTLLIAANWKMNPPPAGFDAPESPYRPTAGADVLICPMAVDLRRLAAAGIKVAAQAVRPEATGAFTGDLSVASAKDAGCSAVLCGHSERRQHHGETDEAVRAQTEAALAAELVAIVCVGEKDGEDREAVLRRQLAGIPDRPEVVIAYEPVWAIGTGKAASAADAVAAATLIRQILPNVSAVLYGGSAKADNAASFLAEPAIGGLLVGGAALKPAEFSAILSVAKGLGR